MFEKNIFEEFPNINSEYKDKIKSKIGRNLKQGPVFTGGDKSSSFLLNQI